MNLVKFSVVVLAFAFVVSCGGQSSSLQNGKSIGANGTSVNSTANTAASNISARRNPQAAEAVAEVVPETDDLYALNCMICHKDTGKGGKVTIKGKNLNAEDLTSEKMKKHSDEKLFAYIADGVPDEGMPAFKGKLSDDEIKSLVSRIRELQSN